MKTSVYRIPYLVGSLLGLLVLAGCAGTAGPATVAAQPIAAKLEPFVAGNTLAGAVMLVADKDKVLDVETVGFADIAGKKPMKPDTLFWIASQSKAMTAAALMMLVDEGKVSLNDPVEKYLPEFGGQMLAVERDADHVVLRKPSRAVTVREVLSHTSGLPFASAMEQPTLDGLPLRDAVRSYAMTPLQYPPGTKYQYSNAGVNTAGRIIEVVSGMPYEKFMQDRLFGPLGMTDTTFWPSERQVNRLAKSYRPNKDKTGLEEQPISQLQYPLWDRTRRFPMPAGGLFSTAGDTAKFCRMLLSGGTVEDAVKQMTSKQTGPQVNDSYGLGLSVGPDWFGHGGAHSTNMQIDRKRGLIFIWMVQHAGFPGNGGQSQGVFTQAAMEKFAPVATGH